MLAGGAYIAAEKFLKKNDSMKTDTKPMSSTSFSVDLEALISSTEESVEHTTVSTTVSTAEDENDVSDIRQAAAGLEENAGTVAYGIHYFNSGEAVVSQASVPLVSASVIKAFIMEYALNQEHNQTQEIAGRPLNQWLQPMIQQSDNEAANALIDFFGMENLNQFFQQQGYQQTRIERRMLDNAARSAGKDNYTSVDDCLLLLNKIYGQQDAYPYNEMLTLMKGQQVRTKLPSKLPSEVITANKTGELADVENDIGLVFAENDPFAIVVLMQDITSTETARQAIGEFTLNAYQQTKEH